MAASTATATAEIISVTDPKNPTAAVKRLVDSLAQNNSLHLPPDYSADNAIKSAWLVIEQNADLKSAETLSVVNAVFDMVVQGLNPSKKQCYFIKYGTKLQMQRSYFGEMALAQRVNPDIEFRYQTIHEGDQVLQEFIGHRKIITKHVQEFGATEKPVIGAYCTSINKLTGEDLGATVMTIAEIKKSWSMSKTYKPDGGNTPHHNFPVEMALRTVIRKHCKGIINSSSDAVLLDSVKRQDIDAIEAEADEIVEVQANGEVLSLPIAQPEPAEEVAPAATETQKPAEGLGF